jgi:hypothetical protein
MYACVHILYVYVLCAHIHTSTFSEIFMHINAGKLVAIFLPSHHLTNQDTQSGTQIRRRKRMQPHASAIHTQSRGHQNPRKSIPATARNKTSRKCTDSGHPNRTNRQPETHTYRSQQLDVSSREKKNGGAGVWRCEEPVQGGKGFGYGSEGRHFVFICPRTCGEKTCPRCVFAVYSLLKCLLCVYFENSAACEVCVRIFDIHVYI